MDSGQCPGPLGAQTRGGAASSALYKSGIRPSYPSGWGQLGWPGGCHGCRVNPLPDAKRGHPPPREDIGAMDREALCRLPSVREGRREDTETHRNAVLNGSC